MAAELLAGMETYTAIIVVAAVLAIIAEKTKQPTITAYIVTGLLLGPAGISFFTGSATTEIISELGIAFLLFLIGLEMEIDDIRDIIGSTVFITVFQMIAVGGFAFFAADFLGFTFVESLFIAGASMYSSTAVVVKLLSDKDEISSLPGRLDVGILLVQDLAVILLMAILATGATTLKGVTVSLVEVSLVVAGIGLISFFSSRYVLPRIFKRISDNSHAFFIHGIAWAFLLISIASELGISTEIGAFIAGLSLAQLPYSHELQERVRPLTDFFMAIFFINVGLGLQKSALQAYWQEAIVMGALLMIVKFGSIFLLTDSRKFTPETSFKTSLNMTQVSEFALIFAAVGMAQGFIGQDIMGFLSMVAVLTMGASSYLINYNNEIYRKIKPLLEAFENEEKRDADIERLENHAVVVGYDSMSERALSALEHEFDSIVVVDNDASNIDDLGRSPYEYIYGDFKHGEIRRSSGVKKADFVLCVSSNPEINFHAMEEAKRDATTFVRAENMEDAAELYDMGAHYVIQKNVLTGDKMSEYLKLYLEDPEIFRKEIEEDVERIEWGDSSV